MKPLISRPIEAFTGTARIPGDKSISHRALILGALAVGETRVSHLLAGDDVRRTAAALGAMGVEIDRLADGAWRVRGRGVGGLAEPATVLDLGNSGTGVRLLMGLAAGHAHLTHFAGDTSLSRRPMGRVAAPLAEMGARITARRGDRLPLSVVGAASLMPIEYTLPVASAQVKSAILLAALHAPGRTTVIEPRATRDHSENLLARFGAEIAVEDLADGGRAITLTGQPELEPQAIEVPGDPSSAAFPLVAAAARPGSRVRLPGVGLNPLRTGLVDCLREMGAEIRVTGTRDSGGEAIADLEVRGGPLSAIAVPAERAPRMIDEYPILAVAAAVAEGRTEMRGLAELRVKESDRIAAMAAGLTAAGIAVEEFPDGLAITGTGGARPAGDGRVETRDDHRIAMSFLVLGALSERPVGVDTGAMIETSFPGFVELMNGLGADIGTEIP